MSTTHQRHPELDLLRTAAVAMMIVYHAAFDLEVFYGWEIGVFEGGWWWLARMTASLFLILVGISFAISWKRARAGKAERQESDEGSSALYGKYFKRGILLLVCATLVSSATAIIDPATYVRFGILHCIAVTILVLPFVTQLKEWTAILGLLVIAVSLYVSDVRSETSLLLPFGVMTSDFRSVDYYPLLPWMGVAFIGYALGHFLYVRFPRRENLIFSRIPESLTWPGKRALWIYLLHQPVLLGILGFFGFL